MDFSIAVFLYGLAVMRVTRLINFDVIMYWLHNLVGNRLGPGSWQAEFLQCPWCVGMWIGLGSAWAPLIFARPMSTFAYVVAYLVVALAASGLTGLLSSLTSEDTAFDEQDEQGGRLP